MKDESPIAFDDPSTVLGAPKDDGVLASTFLVQVVEGADVGAKLSIAPSVPSPALVGKSETCDLRISDPEVSRRHIALDPTGRRLRITDLGSTNGTFVDGVAIEVAFLRGGELVRIGSTALRIEAHRASPARLPFATRFGSLIGASPEMRRLYPLCDKLAASNVSVIIEGETGTGKEVLAASLHGASARADGPYVIFDCTSVPQQLFESELFGHEKGAFTGAIHAHQGLFEQAHKGTLFIDELGDLELPLQAKLLRAVESGEVRRVGGKRPIPVDVRILCATRRDLDREVQAGRFRDDLFHRLAIGRIELPPLRRRNGDIPILVEFFWKHLGGDARGPATELVKKWTDLAWPGNVRELRNAIARTIALGELATLESPANAREDATRAPNDAREVMEVGVPMTRFIEDALARGDTFSDAREKLSREFERGFLERLIEKHGGDLNAAARAAGIGRRYLNLLRSRSK